ncbi:MAG TPA: hypothetical protein VMH04_21670 [Candidatus Solibacter sp.]|nr:hypothetical protein [Candidatus Solibacter sp.]
MPTKSKSPRKAASASPKALEAEQIPSAVEDVIDTTDFIDIHTHLYSPSFGNIGLWGIDELLTYHYLEAEFFRSSTITPEKYWTLSKPEQADAIWQVLFVDNTPITEATRGVIAVLQAFALPTGAKGLKEARAFFRSRKIEAHIRETFKLAGISTAVMTNDPLDPAEHQAWMKGIDPHPKLKAVIRLDRILRDWPDHWRIVANLGYAVDAHAMGKSIAEIRRFLSDWRERMSPVYMAVSLPDTFQFPADSIGNKILAEAVLPACREFNLPLSLMIGVRRQVNPRIRLAGDAVGKANLRAAENLCRDFPDNRFLISVLSRENQHELCVYARKFSNLMPFGCWWFLNNPSIVEEITRERIEMLGASFIPQHSDARVLEQLIYKWRNTRRTMARVLSDTYTLLARDGRPITRQDIQRVVSRMFRGNYEAWTAAARQE